MDEQKINFETAKLAKEKGFNIPVEWAWQISREFLVHDSKDRELSNWNESNMGAAYSAPTQTLLQKWLRDIHWIEVYPYAEGRRKNDTLEYQCEVTDDRINNSTTINGRFKKYEEALEVGLQEALKFIK